MRQIRQFYRRLKRTLKIVIGKELAARPQIIRRRELHGSEYGGWIICPDHIDSQSIVYAIGVGSDITFDLSLINKYGNEVWAFDPTPRSIQWVQSQRLPKQFHFQAYGLADYDGLARFEAPADPHHVSFRIKNSQASGESSVIGKVYTISSIMQMLGHDHIDILKMDIEGAEYSVIENLIKSNLDINQLLIEFHHWFPAGGIASTRRAIELLNAHGFKIFAISPTGREYSFIRE